jgi:hypothetical protein
MVRVGVGGLYQRRQVDLDAIAFKGWCVCWK